MKIYGVLLIFCIVLELTHGQFNIFNPRRRPNRRPVQQGRQPRQNNGVFRPVNNLPPRRPNNVRRPVNPNNVRRPIQNPRRPVVNNNVVNRRPINNNNNVVTRPVNNNNRRPNANIINNFGSNNFRATPANARDARGTEVYPGCNGTVCLPEAPLCAERQQKSGHFFHGGKSYWVSFLSSENALRNARWNWFTGRNYCRKMCMDMISIESQREEQFVVELMKNAGIRDVHTAGRLCDKEVEGCETQARFQPLSINGWFWASTLQMMPPTNAPSSPRRYNNWSPTGSKGQKQPDGIIKPDGFGSEACVALLDNKFGDGVRWHDEPCSNRRVLVCEDLPAPNINFVRNQNPGVNIP